LVADNAGVEISGIESSDTRSPFTVTTSSVDAAGLGLMGNSASSWRPDMLCDPNNNAPHQARGITGAEAAHRAQHGPYRSGAGGAARACNAGRGMVHGPGHFNWDRVRMKEVHLYRARIVPGFAARSLTSITMPIRTGSSALTSPAVCSPSISTSCQARQVQIAAKLIF
jgi:hypothetical protein